MRTRASKDVNSLGDVAMDEDVARERDEMTLSGAWESEHPRQRIERYLGFPGSAVFMAPDHCSLASNGFSSIASGAENSHDGERS